MTAYEHIKQLEAVIAKAGEVMRERSLAACDPDLYPNECDKHITNDCRLAICALPGVTLEDLIRDDESAVLEKLQPIYQSQSPDGDWVEQTKSSYEFNKEHGWPVRILYAAPAPASTLKP